MFYILTSQDTYSIKPENGYGNGTTIQFRKGLFIFNTEKTDDIFLVNNDTHQIEIAGEKFSFKDNLVFTNITKAEIYFIKLKIDEMDRNGFNYFMPKSYQNYINRFKELVSEYPEYSI